MTNNIMSLQAIAQIVLPLAQKYHIDKVYIFGSYARNEATENSDIDLLVFGGAGFKPASVFAFAEEIRCAVNKEIDVYEIREVNVDSQFYKNIMKERVEVA